ncbi:hypothetical protein [Methanobrevibacter millerae]|uniref:Uncharacterized protein n=1 Tax=Methanobrevibacter millerae TaxID=230361 RepID=A0A1G5XU85_9EURY|nr:hypothetical protein [Methanobrevibacter millerae]SDA73434.1 hypothetical protein SAMN02910315_02456 [Methanobrevibacter millerae]
MKNNHDSNRSLLYYLILGSVVTFLLILFPISFFYIKNMIFLLVVLGSLVLFAVIFKGFRNENKKTLDFFEKDASCDVLFASTIDYDEKKLYSLNESCDDESSRLKKL